MKGTTKRKSFKESDLHDAIIRRALGYDATEVIEEYTEGEQGQIRLVKRKVTTKNVPPDTTALKMLLDKSEPDVSSLTDKQLEDEKIRLLNLLSESNLKSKELKSAKRKKSETK